MEEQDRTDKPLLESLLRMHAQLRLPLEQALAELLHCDPQVSLVSVDRRRFSESIIHASKPSCRLLLKVPGANQDWMVDLGPCLVLPIAHGLLGGHASLPLKPDRPFTGLERRLMRCVVRPLARALDQQWQGILPGPLQLAEETPTSGWLEGEEEVFQVVLAVSLEQHQGFLTLCMPAVMIEAVAEAILSGNAPLPAPGEQGQDQQQEQQEQQEEQEQEPAGLADEVRVSVHLPATQIAGQDLEGLQVGEIITTDIASDVPLEMQLDGRPLYQSEAGIVDGRLAVRITGLLDSGESMDQAAENPLEELAD
ncbi:MAG: FliM/FliN family flagellar motor switch protein [Pirellulaceae bacterium]